MVEANLNTTNLLLGIMAAVSVLEALALIAVGVMAYKAYSAAMQTIRDIEQRHVTPLVARAHAVMTTAEGVLADVKGITSRVGAQTERVDSAIRSTIDRVDETADRVRSSVASRINRFVGAVQTIRSTVGSIFNGHDRRTSGEATGRA